MYYVYKLVNIPFTFTCKNKVCKIFFLNEYDNTKIMFCVNLHPYKNHLFKRLTKVNRFVPILLLLLIAVSTGITFSSYPRRPERSELFRSLRY